MRRADAVQSKKTGIMQYQTERERGRDDTFHTTDRVIEKPDLTIGPKFTQVVIRTARGAEHLRWDSAYTLTEEMIDSAKANYAAESSKFETAFAKAVDAMEIE